MGEHLYEMPPFRLTEHDIRVERSPIIGEHTDEVLRGMLGMGGEEIEALRATGALT
jgi:formyl-CoA transferase